MSSFTAAGNNNGVVTLTTPTLTPSTMRNIEQSILDATPYEENHEEVGSFIPPLPTCIQLVTSHWQGGSVSTKLDSSEVIEEESGKPSKKGKKMGRGNKSGGRRPRQDKNISPEEEERRRLRRERNKLAAARCRKRRVDHTNRLVEETQNLESKKSRLQDQITLLQAEREELEFILQTHNPNCTKNSNNNNKPKRPNSLPMTVIKQESLSTPSTSVPGLDLDWSLLPPTGLTPSFTPITPSINILSLMDEDHNTATKKSKLVQL